MRWTLVQGKSEDTPNKKIKPDLVVTIIVEKVALSCVYNKKIEPSHSAICCHIIVHRTSSL